MNRRGMLRSALTTAAAAFGFSRFATPAQAQTKHIRLYVEMDIAPGREKEMLDTFHNSFVPEAVKHEGYIRVKMLKRRTIIQGTSPRESQFPLRTGVRERGTPSKVDRLGRTPTRVATRRENHDDPEELPSSSLRRGLIRRLNPPIYGCGYI